MKQFRSCAPLTLAFLLDATGPAAQVVVGQDGKDVVFLPTPPELVERMLDLAGVGPSDYVVDLGSGDGRIVIAAAKRGARATGIEFDAALVEASAASAGLEGVSHKTTFLRGDFFEIDFSGATVVTTFLGADLMTKLRPRLLDLEPGARIVSNSYTMEGWSPDSSVTLENCTAWCTAYLWVVPASVAGIWRSVALELVLKQDFQRISGTMSSGGRRLPIADGRVRADRLSFSAGGAAYAARVVGNAMLGAGPAGNWVAARVEQGR